MTCPHCQEADEFFSQKWAASELKSYQEDGPDKTTHVLIEAIKSYNVQNWTLLDIGGGIGAIQHELMAAGIAATADVDASSGYLDVAKSEATRRGYVDRAQYHHGDFVDISPQLDPADIVTLDRVLCCYPDVEALVRLSSARAQRLYGLVYPRDTWLTRLFMPLFNLFVHRLQGSKFRNFIHSTPTIDTAIRENGLERVFYRNIGLWRVIVYSRQA